MRLAFPRQMAPRGAHPPDAKFLRGKPSALSAQLTKTFHTSQLQNAKNSGTQVFSPTSNIDNQQPTMEEKPPAPKTSSSSAKIPLSSSLDTSSNTAPLSQQKVDSSTGSFHTVLRTNTRRKKLNKTSPKNYYTCAHNSNTKESENISVFTKLNNIMQAETNNNNPSPVTPNPDSTMQDTQSQIITLEADAADAETDAIMAEFDSAQPNKFQKTVATSTDPTSTPHVSNQPSVQEGNSTPSPAPTARPFPQSTSIVTPDKTWGGAPEGNNQIPNPAPPQPKLDVPTHNGPTGTNVGMFTSSTPTQESSNPDLHNAPSIAQQNASSRKIPIKSITKHIVTCRFKLHISGVSCNLPHLVKQVTKLFRQVDSALHILPFDRASSTDNDVLDNEENLPIEEELLKKWVVEVRTIKDKLHFSMRYSCIKEIPALAKKIFPWMRANKSYVKIDEIDSPTISCLGLFEGLHPDFRNRDNFKKYCISHIHKYNPALKPAISVYPRAVYAGAGLQKVESRAVVLEVSTGVADAVLQAMAHSFENDYSSVTFVPFTKTDESYSETLRQVMIVQNSMLHDTKRKVLHGLKNIHERFTMLDGTSMTVKQWLLSAQHNEATPSSQPYPLIDSVDTTTNKSISILFHKKHEVVLHTLLKDLEQELLKYFPPTVLEHIYTATPTRPVVHQSRVLTDSEKSWADMIKRKYIVNPQEEQASLTTPPSKNRKVIYHSSSEPPAQIQANSFDPTPTSTLESIVARLSQLEEKSNNIAKNQNDLIKTTINTAMQSTESKLLVQTNSKLDAFATRLDTLETSTFNVMEKFSKSMQVLSANVERLCAHSLPNESTTAAAETALVGGNGQ